MAFSAAAKRRSGRSPARSCPPPSEEDAKRVLRQAHWEHVKRLAEGIVADLKQYGGLDDREKLDEAVNQTADSAVTYTHDALDIIAYSENWLAGEDSGVEGGSDFTATLTQMAYYAIEADIYEALRVHFDVDVNALD